MKAIEPNLYTRNGYFYFRRTVPQRYWHITIRRELTIALATQNHAEARSIASQVNFRLGNLLTYINLSEANELDAYEKLKAKVQGELEEIQASVGYKHVTAKLFMGNGVKRREKQRTFREVWELYLEDCKYDGHKSRDHKKSTYLMFEELLNPKCFSEIAQAEALAFKQSILKIPPNAKKKFKGESYKAIEAGIIVLTIHDSFIVAEEHEMFLRNAMQKAFRKVMGTHREIQMKVTRNGPLSVSPHDYTPLCIEGLYKGISNQANPPIH